MYFSVTFAIYLLSIMNWLHIFLVEELLPFGVEFTVSIPVLNISRHWQLTILDRELLVEPSCDMLIQASYAEI